MHDKIPVAILGATGMVGQKFVELLSHHPWFEVVAVAASERSQGKRYADAAKWMMPGLLCPRIADLPVLPCSSDLPCKVLFSGLDASAAATIERNFAQKGSIVISNAKSHRMDPSVPLLIPEVNSSHLELLPKQPYQPGAIVTNPNCSVIGFATALKPIDDIWGIERVHVVTLQAISGAGYPGIPSFDIIDNIIPFISGEEEKMEMEPLKILGQIRDGSILPHSMKISAQCNRVAVMDGHMACVSVQLRKSAASADIIGAWQNFSTEPQQLNLPMSPACPIVYFTDERHPQPKLHRHLDKGMAVSIGRLRPCPLYDWKFTILSHNTIRGAAGCAVLNAELMAAKGLLP